MSYEQGTQHTVEAAIAAAGSKATYTGSGVVLSGWFFSSEFAVFVGIVIGVLGFLVNWFYKHKLTNTEIQFKLEELQLKQEQNEREKIEHKFKLQTLKHRADDHSMCSHEQDICRHVD
jgi:hypothetical protein